MSSKKFVYLFMVAIVCGLIAGGTAYGQSTSSITFKGTVMNDDGTPAPGYVISGETVPANAAFNFIGNPSRTDGSYDIVAFSFTGAKLNVGDMIKITVTDAAGSAVEIIHTLTVADANSSVVNLDITILGITVSVDVAPSIFSAETTGTGTVTVTVDSDGPVTDEIVTLSLSPAGGSITSPATNNGDGTYSATYTSGRAAGNVTLTATATQANKSGTANIVINAGPPAAIAVSAAPETVSSFASAIITAMVTDSNGNGVGGLTPTGTTASGGTLASFAPTRTFGSYTATYTAPMVDAEGTETVTVTADGVSGQVSLTLTPVPPVEVSILDIMGIVCKVDGITPADGVTVTVTVGSNAPDTGTTDTDGSYTATFFNPLGTFARTGDIVSIVVTDDTGAERGRKEFPLNNDQLGAGGTATFTAPKVMTDIFVPPRSVNVLVVEGVVLSDDGVSPVENVDFTITVTVKSSLTGEVTDASVVLGDDGIYTATAVDLFASVASTGDLVSTVVVTDADGAVRGSAELELTNAHLDEDGSGMATLNVPTNIILPPKSVGILIVEGVAYRDDETTPVGQGFDVTVMVGSRSDMGTTEANGSFSVTFFDPLAPVASTGDPVSIVVSDSSGGRGSAEFTLTNVQLGDTDSATVTQDVITDVGATSNILAVTGTVYFKNGNTPKVPAASHLREGDLTVVATNITRNVTVSGPVDGDGGYDVTFVNLLSIVAETGDSLTVEVQDEAGETVGTTPHLLTTAEVVAAKAEIDVDTTVPAAVRILDITGSVIDLDGSPAGPGLEVSLTIAMNGHTVPPAKTLTDAVGGYEYTFVQLLTPVAATGDVLTVDVLRSADQFRGRAVVPLRSAELIDGQLTVDPIMLVPPRLELGGLSINPHYTGIQDPIIQQFLGMDLAGLAAAGASAVDPSGNLLVSLPPSPFLLVSPLLAAIGAFQLELPQGFDPDDPNIAKESFGNAITTRPTAWTTFSAEARHPGRWVNGDQLNLYISGAPTIESVTFALNGTPMSATSVPAGGSFMYNFQLEEEWIALFSGSMPTFGAVQLMIDGGAPIDMTRNNMGVWSADVALTPGSKVSYYYMIELSKPYVDPMGGIAITKFPFLDPRNRQVRTDGLSQLFEALLGSELAAIGEGVRSVFSVPAVDLQQSLWVGTLPLAADGAYQLDVNVSYRGGYQENITDKTFYVDRTPPTADVALHLDAPGSNAGLYMRDDGTYVATGPMPGEASLALSAIPGASSEAAGYMYQLAKLDASGYPGTWNPVITADLLPLNLDKLLNDPTSVLPMTFFPPHQLDMLIRNSAGGGLLGTYGLRAVGIDSLLNMDSGRGPGVVVDLVPPDPDIAMVSYVTADFDGNGAIEGLETQSTAGDVVVFSDSLVTLTVDVVERTVHPLASIAIEVEMPGVGSQPVAMFSGDQLAATMLGDQFMVTLPVPDVPVLPDRGAHVILRTVTTNALNVVSTQEVSVAYQRRTPPEVSAIHTYVTDRHPDSGAAQGMITVSAFTQAMTLPDAAAVQLEIRRSADADWMPLGIVQLAGTTVTSHVQIAIIEDLVNAILSGAPTAPISTLYREWPLTVDSATLEDTIMDDSPAASDASLDDNPYVLRAIAVDTAGTGYPSADGVTDSLSLDNYSPTAITQVANEVEMVAAREDGSYYVSGLIAEGVPDPMLTLISRTGAHPNTFTGGLKLAINDAAGEAVAIDETVFNAAGNHNYTAAFNLGSIPNGVYTVMAVGHTADGAPEERIVAMAVTVEVGNFTPPDNFADPTVDILSVTNTRGQANSPSDTDAMYPIGFPAVGDEVCATLIVPNVSAGDVDALIGDDLMSAAMMGALTVMDPDANNNILVCIDTSGLDEGMYSLVGVVSKPNGSVQFGLPSIRVDRTAPVIEIVSPLEGHQVSSLPAVQVTYSDDTGFDPQKTDPRAVTVTLTRLGSDKTVNTNPEMIRSVSAAGEVLTQTGSIVYTHDDQLAGGAYRIDVSVTDTLGNTATAEPVEFTSEGVAATVSIITPSAGQVVDPDQAFIISAAFTGIGEITVDQLLINGGTYKPQSVKGNLLTHTIQPPFGVLFKRGSGNRISIKIVDEEGNTAEATTNFAIAKDTIPPVVATYSPLGIIRTDRPIAAATVTDASGIKMSSLTIIIAGVPGNQGTGRRSSPTSTTVTFTPSIAVTPGPYTARVTVEDVHGNRTEAEWQFTVELDVTPPSITTSSPHGVIRSDKPIISVSASDDMSGVDTIEIGVKGEGNQTVEGVTSVRSDKTSATFTPAASLTSGTYTVDVKLADMRGNKASGQWQFTVELDTIPPSITITRPMQEHTENRRPTVSASYTDNLSGVDAESITLSLDGAAIEPDAVSETQVMFTPTFDLTFGQHTVKLEVSDMAPSANTAVQEWSFFVERMGIANARNYPNPFDGDTTIALRISRQASITVHIYDFTGRLVAEPISNSVREAGPVEIEWDGQTNAGDNLARGVYFCHILMESELEPQSAILKMAIISD